MVDNNRSDGYIKLINTAKRRHQMPIVVEVLVVVMGLGVIAAALILGSISVGCAIADMLSKSGD